MPTYNLNAEILIGNSYPPTVNISPYILGIERNVNLCDTIQEVRLTASVDLIDFLDGVPWSAVPYNTLTISEFGTQVLTGYLSKIDRRRSPASIIHIIGHDRFKLARDYFIDENGLISQGESVEYWLNKLLSLAGLSYVSDVSSVTNARLVSPGVEFRLRSVADAVLEVLAYASGYLYTAPDGVIHFMKGSRSDGLIYFRGGPITYSIDDDPTILTGGNTLSAEFDQSDKLTRDVVKVWGMAVHPYGGTVTKISSVKTKDLGLPVHKTVLYSTPMIQTQTEADRLSSEIIKELGKLTEIKPFECLGNPDIQVGLPADYDIDLESSTITNTGIITSIRSNMSADDGYTMNVKIDELCPRFAGWSRAVFGTRVYSGTTVSGIYYSTDGSNWIDFNDGLPTGNRYVKRIAVDPFDNKMAIVNNSLYSRAEDDTEWAIVTLPTPSNDAGDSNPPLTPGMLIAVDDGGSENVFNLLTTNTTLDATVSGVSDISRTWLYTTDDLGLTWTSEGLSDVTVSGDPFNFMGIDLISPYGTPQITAINANGGIGAIPVPLPSGGDCFGGLGEFILINPTIVGWFRDSIGRITCCNNVGDFGIKTIQLTRSLITGTSPDCMLTLGFRITGSMVAQDGAGTPAVNWGMGIALGPGYSMLEGGAATVTDTVNKSQTASADEIVQIDDIITFELNIGSLGSVFTGRILYVHTYSSNSGPFVTTPCSDPINIERATTGYGYRVDGVTGSACTPITDAILAHLIFVIG